MGTKNNISRATIPMNMFSIFILNIVIVRALNTYNPKMTKYGNIFKKYFCKNGTKMHVQNKYKTKYCTPL